jgi:hypothetical protein
LTKKDQPACQRDAVEQAGKSRLLTILLKTDSDFGGRLRSRSPWPHLLKGELTASCKLLDIARVTRGSTLAQAGKKSLLSVFLTENSQEPRNLNSVNYRAKSTILFYMV